MANGGLMVSVSGIRGRVGEALTPEVVAQYAAAFGAWAGGRSTTARIVVGRDSRVSGPMFHRVVLSALQSVGCDVIDIDLTTTPTCQLAVEEHHAAGGLMISASHNPIEWNALKFIGPSGLFLEASEGAEMRALVEKGIPRATWDKLGVITTDDGAIARHIERVLAIPYIDRGELERLVLDSRADVGFAVDPDVDRLALVSNEGKAIGEDYTLALAARLVLRYRRGPVVTNLSTSRVVEDVATAAGVPVVRAPVGEVNVAVRMREEKSPVGGEGNGGVILSEVHLGRDAPVGAALLLQLMHEENRPLSRIISDFPRYVIVKDKLDRPNADLGRVYDALRSAMPDAEADTQDGLRLSWQDRWVHVRPSGTEPIVRVIAEAPSREDADALIARSRTPLDALSAKL
jgi:phosphomannomutase